MGGAGAGCSAAGKDKKRPRTEEEKQKEEKEKQHKWRLSVLEWFGSGCVWVQTVLAIMSNALTPHLQLMRDKLFNAGEGFDLKAEAYEAKRSMTPIDELGPHCFHSQARILRERLGLDETRVM